MQKNLSYKAGLKSKLISTTDLKTTFSKKNLFSHKFYPQPSNMAFGNSVSWRRSLFPGQSLIWLNKNL